MKRYIIIFIISSISTIGYGQTVKDVFKDMPSEFLPAFSEADKTMLLVDSSLSVIPYALGEIERLEYTDDFLSIRTSKVGTMQIKLLPMVNKTFLIALVKTVCTEICDSNIQFFTTKWEEIEKDNILPTISLSFFIDESKKGSYDFNSAVSKIDILPLQFKFDKESNNMQVKLDIVKHLSKEDAEKLKPFLTNESIDLKWNMSNFVY